MRLQRQCSHFGERSAVCPEDRALTQVWTLPSRFVSVFSQTARLVPDKPHRIAWPSCLIDKLPTSEHENQLHTVLCKSFQAWRTRQNEVIIKVCDCGQQMKSLDSNVIKHPRQSKKPVKAMAMDCTKRAASSVYRSGHYQSPNVNAETTEVQMLTLDRRLPVRTLKVIRFPFKFPRLPTIRTALKVPAKHRRKGVKYVQIDFVESRAAIVDSTGWNHQSSSSLPLEPMGSHAFPPATVDQDLHSQQTPLTSKCARCTFVGPFAIAPRSWLLACIVLWKCHLCHVQEGPDISCPCNQCPPASLSSAVCALTASSLKVSRTNRTKIRSYIGSLSHTSLKYV